MHRFATLSLIAGLTVATSAQGATVTDITLTALDTNSQFNSSLGTPVNAQPGPVPTLSGATNFGGPAATFSFTVNGLDLTGDATANDSVVFSFLVTATGGDVANLSSNTFSFGVDGASDPTDNEIDPGEALTFSDLAAAATLGDGNLGTVSVLSANFEFFQARFPGGDDVLLTGSDGVTTVTPAVAPNGGGNDPYDFSADPQTAFTVTGGNGGVNGSGFGVDTVRAVYELEFVPVPEPGSLALLGVGGLMMARRRRD